jgi:glycyl-tRNA synthetase
VRAPWLELHSDEAQHMIEKRLTVPAYSYALKCSHTFNVLDARGAVSQPNASPRSPTCDAWLPTSLACLNRRSRKDRLWIERRVELGHPFGVAYPAEGTRPRYTPVVPGWASTARRHAAPASVVFRTARQQRIFGNRAEPAGRTRRSDATPLGRGPGGHGPSVQPFSAGAHPSIGPAFTCYASPRTTSPAGTSHVNRKETQHGRVG